MDATSNCPTKRTITMKIKGEVKSKHSSSFSPKKSSSYTLSSSSSLSDYEIKPSERDMLVIRRVLVQVPKELESYQRENIFHTRFPYQ